jgi:hypothetical protein
VKRMSLRLMWLPALVLALFAMGCAQTCPSLRMGASDQCCEHSKQCCASQAACNHMQPSTCGQAQAGCKNMGAGCGQAQAGCKGMGAGCGQAQAGCKNMGPGCGQAQAGCKGMGPGCGQMQYCGPRSSGTVVAPSEWGPKPSLDDYICCRGHRGGRCGRSHEGCGPGRHEARHGASCTGSCKQMGSAMPGHAGEMKGGQPPCAGAPAGRPPCCKQGGMPMAPSSPHCEQKK